jgi:CHASE3 domain sensor protein
MYMPSLKDRVESLEIEVAALRDAIHVRENGDSKNWQRTIGAFTGDDGMQQILRDAMQLREAERKKARTTGGRRRKARR